MSVFPQWVEKEESVPLSLCAALKTERWNRDGPIMCQLRDDRIALNHHPQARCRARARRDRA
ncbi:MAG: hypothetical protein AAFQ13_03910, partial [Pseudomonadota bacterium]